MKKCFIYVIAAISALVVSCNKEVDTPDNNTGKVDQNLVSMTFKAALEGDDTKTTLNTSDGMVAWAAGDAVKFVWELDGTPSEGVSDELVAGDIDGDGAASFTASVPAEFAMTEAAYKEAGGKSLHLYAVYPSDIVVDYSTASSFYLTVPTVQDGSFAKASIALAKWNKDVPAADLEFKNLCGLLQIVIADANVRKIVLHSDDYIAGKVNYSVNNMKPVAAAYSLNNELKKDITINVSGAGTYYVAVLPTCEDPEIGVTNMYVSLYNESGALIGDKTTTNELTVARKQIRKLGTIATDAVERFFVKATAAGAGDGSSWDNAADYAALKTKLTGNGTCKIYMSAETYNTVTSTTIAKANTSSNYEIIGGFPTTNTGCDLSGRTLEGTVLVKATSGSRFLVQYAGVIVVNGITFQNFSTTGTGGGAVYLDGTDTDAAFFAKNCTFRSNTATNLGGVIYVNAGAVTATKCLFQDNTATNPGGVIYVNAGAVTATKCLFQGNTVTGNSKSGGAIHVVGGTAKLSDSSFIDNTAVGTTSYGGAICAAGGNVFIDRCYFRGSKALATTGGHHIHAQNASVVGINNSVFAGPFGLGIRLIHHSGTGSLTLVNTTINAQLADALIHNAGTGKIINCIIQNAGTLNSVAGDMYSLRSATGSTMSLSYDIWNKANTSSGYISPTVTNCVSGVKGKGESGAFTEWYKTDYTTMNANDQTNSDAVSDVRGYVHYYSWDGTIPNELGAITNPSINQVKTAIGSSDFLTWLESSALKVNGKEALAVDIRGNARNTSAMWPGSYEE